MSIIQYQITHQYIKIECLNDALFLNILKFTMNNNKNCREISNKKVEKKISNWKGLVGWNILIVL